MRYRYIKEPVVSFKVYRKELQDPAVKAVLERLCKTLGVIDDDYPMPSTGFTLKFKGWFDVLIPRESRPEPEKARGTQKSIYDEMFKR